MKKAVSTKQTEKDILFATAERVFSKGLVKEIRSRGRDFLEAAREGSYVFDADGNRCLDCYTSAGVFNLGRRNPVIAARLKKALLETDQSTSCCRPRRRPCSRDGSRISFPET